LLPSALPSSEPFMDDSSQSPTSAAAPHISSLVVDRYVIIGCDTFHNGLLYLRESTPPPIVVQCNGWRVVGRRRGRIDNQPEDLRTAMNHGNIFLSSIDGKRRLLPSP